MNMSQPEGYQKVRPDVEDLLEQTQTKKVQISPELSAYGTAIAERNYIDDQLKTTLKELADIKFALDQSAIVAITDAQGIICYVNETFCKISKYSRVELLGKTHKIINSGFHSTEFFQQLWRTIQGGVVWKGEIKNRAKDGTEYWVDTTIVPFLDEGGKPYQYLAIRYDITERKKVEEKLRQKAEELEQAMHNLKHTQIQLVQTEKMSSLGQLVAGIAHEINNPVSFIYGNLIHTSDYVKNLLGILHLYQKHYPNPVQEIQGESEKHDLSFLIEDLPKMLNSMKVGANRIREIVLSLRNFSRLDESQMKKVDIHEGIDSTLLILQNLLKPKGEMVGIKMIKDYGKLPLVECYASQLNQVFMNILANAIDALEELRILDSSVYQLAKERGEFYPRCPLPMIRICTKIEGKNQVIIQIDDNGPGIESQLQKRLFDPFFTTKPAGKGTGLGLSIAQHIIVEKHKGQLACISHPGQGTKFVISIPIVQGH